MAAARGASLAGRTEHLTTYRAHPLVHVSFLLSAVPILAVEDNTATPAVVLTVYACLGALPHANVRWTYGRLGGS